MGFEFTDLGFECAGPLFEAFFFFLRCDVKSYSLAFLILYDAEVETRIERIQKTATILASLQPTRGISNIMTNDLERFLRCVDTVSNPKVSHRRMGRRMVMSWFLNGPRAVIHHLSA